MHPARRQVPRREATDGEFAARKPGTKFAAVTSGLRESKELAILVAFVGPTALRVDRPSIDARPDPCPR